MAENDLLEAINKLAVKEESELIQRIKISNLVETPVMSVQNFLSLLHGQAKLCWYKVQCEAIEADNR